MTMIETAEIVAERYGVSREAQDEYALQSQQRTAQAQAEGRFDAEIAPLTVADEGRPTRRPARPPTRRSPLKQDEGNRAADHARRPAGAAARCSRTGSAIKEGRFITAGNASQLSDGAPRVGADGGEGGRAKRGLKPLGAYRGMAVAGCDPDEMGIGPVFAVPKLLKAHGLKIDDIGLWELNEAFAVQVLYCRDKLGIDTTSSTSTAARSPSAIPTA